MKTISAVLAAVEHLVTEKSVEVALSAAAGTYLSTHSLSAVAVAVLTSVGASLGVHIVPTVPAAAPKA